MVAYLLFSPPQIPIKKYIGINIASKKINKDNRSPLRKTPLTSKCNTRIDATKPLLLEYFSVTDRKESRTRIDVKDNNRCDIPENPKLILIPYELIQLIDSNSW